jgi:uncharacterized protein
VSGLDQLHLADPYVQLADWRRRVSELWAAWRAACIAGDPHRATEMFREAKDRLFRDHPQSPIPADERASFRGLSYWDYDPEWRLTVFVEREPEASGGPGHGLVPTDGGAPPSLPMSGAGAISFRRVGWVTLGGPLLGERIGLQWIEGYGNGLFLPLRDGTSGVETYGAGRYLLDTAKSADHGIDQVTGGLVVDLNMAFHPSCAYDPRWSCPLAPPDDRIDVRVTVGERLRSS